MKKSHFGIFIIGLIVLIISLVLLKSDFIGRIIYPFPHQEIVYKYADKYQVDPFLVAAIIRAESKFNSQAESKVGAKGLMQLMPETAAWAAKKMGMKDFTTNKLYDNETNIKIGCWYLANLSKEFRGNPVLIIAAYNGGRGNVKGWLESERWTGEKDTLEQIPFAETRYYVKAVMDNWEKYSQYWGTM